MLTNKNLFLFLSVMLLPCCLQAQNADAVIKKYIDFIGGKKNWEKVKTLKTSGKYNYGGIEFPFTAYSKAPNHYKFIVPSEGKYYAQAFDGEKGWKIDAFKNETAPTMLTGKAARSMANEADVELQNAFIDYKRKGYTLTLEGKDTVEGKNCIGMKLMRQNGDVETYYFDELTYELVMKVSPSKNVELQGAILNTLYSDYRDVNGIKIPFRSISKSDDQLILEVTIEKAEANVAIDDKEFQPPN
jgi:outer membrane lipoprotein-sorting protein